MGDEKILKLSLHMRAVANTTRVCTSQSYQLRVIDQSATSHYHTHRNQRPLGDWNIVVSANHWSGTSTSQQSQSGNRISYYCNIYTESLPITGVFRCGFFFLLI